jgi:hypothetical protein
MTSSSSRLFLHTRIFLFTFAALWFTVFCKAQDKVELYGGYSYFRASIQEGRFAGPIALTSVSQNANLNGWEFSGQYKSCLSSEQSLTSTVLTAR